MHATDLASGLDIDTILNSVCISLLYFDTLDSYSQDVLSGS